MEGLILGGLLVCVFVLIIHGFASSKMNEIAVMKGYPEGGYFGWCFWLGIVGYLMVIALPDRGNTQGQSSPAASVATSVAAPDENDELPEL